MAEFQPYQARHPVRVLARPALPGEVIQGTGGLEEMEGNEVLVLVGPFLVAMDRQLFDQLYESEKSP